MRGRVRGSEHDRSWKAWTLGPSNPWTLPRHQCSSVFQILPPHPQRRRAAQHERALPLLGRALAIEVGKPPQQRGYDDLRLDARQRCAETEVGAVPEGQMMIVLAAKIESIGIGEMRRIAVG